jgi:hypothetical protein
MGRTQFLAGTGIIIFATSFRTHLSSPIQWVLETFSLGLKQPELGADSLLPTGVKVNKVHALLYAFMKCKLSSGTTCIFLQD